MYLILRYLHTNIRCLICNNFGICMIPNFANTARFPHHTLVYIFACLSNPSVSSLAHVYASNKRCTADHIQIYKLILTGTIFVKLMSNDFILQIAIHTVIALRQSLGSILFLYKERYVAKERGRAFLHQKFKKCKDFSILSKLDCSCRNRMER